MADSFFENNKITFNFNGKVYKTLPALKQAQSRLIKQEKKQASKVAYRTKHGEAKIADIIAKREITKGKNQFAKDLLNAGDVYNEEKNRTVAANCNLRNRVRKKYEKGLVLGSLKIVSFFDNLYYEQTIIETIMG